MFRRMGTAGQALLAALVLGGGLGYAVAQESGESTVDVVKVEPIGASTQEQSLSPAEQAEAAGSADAAASDAAGDEGDTVDAEFEEIDDAEEK